jgi:hypothetical protein
MTVTRARSGDGLIGGSAEGRGEISGRSTGKPTGSLVRSGPGRLLCAGRPFRHASLQQECSKEGWTQIGDADAHIDKMKPESTNLGEIEQHNR